MSDERMTFSTRHTQAEVSISCKKSNFSAPVERGASELSSETEGPILYCSLTYWMMRLTFSRPSVFVLRMQSDVSLLH